EIPFASAGLELPATSLIAPFLPDIPNPRPHSGYKRRGHNKAGRARQYGWKSLSRLLAERMNPGLAAGRRERQCLARRHKRRGPPPRKRDGAGLILAGRLRAHRRYGVGLRVE